MKKDDAKEKSVKVSGKSAEIKAKEAEPVKISVAKTKSEPNKEATTARQDAKEITSKVNNMEKDTTNSDPSISLTTEEWVNIGKAKWPPPVFIKKSIPNRERFYLENRWYSQWSYYDEKASDNKAIYFRYQQIIVIGALIIPALVSINSTLARFLAGLLNAGDINAEAMWRIGLDSITVMVSLMVAGAAALESLHKYGDNWNEYRSAAEELQAEKNFYDMQAGPYVNNPNPFATFVERVEGIIANQNGKYFQAVQQQLQKQGEENENIVASFKSGDDGEDTYELSVETNPPPSQPIDVG
ncbi:MAG: hypothetical protein Phog2KO_16060 [Phototrophicaceae bacterium]